MTTILETDISALGKQLIESTAAQNSEPIIFRRSEMLITLPSCGQVSCDGAFEVVGEDAYGVAEFKRRPTPDLFAQVERWYTYASFVWMGFETPNKLKMRTRARLDDFARKGVGIVEVVNGFARITNQAVFQDADLRLFESAYRASDGSIDPPSGAAGVKRASGDRILLATIAAHVGSAYLTMKELHADKRFRGITANALRNLIDRERDERTGLAVGMDYTEDSITQFFAPQRKGI